MTESLLERLIESGGIKAGRPKRDPPAPDRAKKKRAARAAKARERGRVIARGHMHPWGKAPPGERLRYRFWAANSFRDGRGRILRLLEAMQSAPGLWWGRPDLRDALAGPGWHYNSIKALVRRAEQRGLVEMRVTGERLPRIACGMPGRRGVATKVYRPTYAGRLLVEICG